MARERAAHRAIARAGRLVARRPGPPTGQGCQRGSVSGGGSPEEAGQFAGDGDDGHVGVFAAAAHRVVDAVQALLGAVGDLQDVVGLPGLAIAQGGADPRRAAVVPGGLDQQPPRERAAGLGDRRRRVMTGLTAPARASARATCPASAGCAKRCQSPASSRWIASALSVSIPRKRAQPRDRRPPAHPRSANREIRSASAALRAVSPSTAASRSREREIADRLREGLAREPHPVRPCPRRRAVIDDRRAAAASSRPGGARSSDRAARRHARGPTRAQPQPAGSDRDRLQLPRQQQPRATAPRPCDRS